MIYKILFVLWAILPLTAISCSQDYLQDYSDAAKFQVVAENSEFVYFGEVVRLYRLPNTPKLVGGYNGLVFRVKETLKGSVSSIMEAERSFWCGVNSPIMTGYWPDKVGKKFVVAAKQINGTFYIHAVYPSEKAMTDLYRGMREAL